MVSIAPQVLQANSGEKRVVLYDLTWQGYQQILTALPQTRAARLTYDCGALEISVLSEGHEFSGRLIELFIRILVVELTLCQHGSSRVLAV